MTRRPLLKPRKPSSEREADWQNSLNSLWPLRLLLLMLVNNNNFQCVESGCEDVRIIYSFVLSVSLEK